MNVEVLARIRPPKRGEHFSLNLSGTRVQATNGTGHIFGAVYKSESLTYDIFRDAFSPLVELFIAGYNVCLLVFGETGSGKSYSLAGEKNSKAGLIPLIINSVFTRIKNERSARKDLRVQRNDINDGVVFVQFYDVFNEKVRDLLLLPHEGRLAINFSWTVLNNRVGEYYCGRCGGQLFVLTRLRIEWSEFEPWLGS